MFLLHESRFDGKKTHKEVVRSRQTTWVKAGEAVDAVGSMLTRLGLYGPASRAWDWWLVRAGIPGSGPAGSTSRSSGRGTP